MYKVTVVFVGMYLLVYLYKCGCGHTQICICLSTRAKNKCFSELFSTSIFLEAGSPTVSGAHQSELEWPVSCKDLGISDSSVLELQMPHMMTRFSMSAGDPKPGPHHYTEVTFPTEPSSKPRVSLTGDIWNSLKGAQWWNVSYAGLM